MKLKTYQLETLEVLRRFLESARVRGPAAAYAAVTDEPEQARRLGPYRAAYRPLPGAPETPYVCLRLPTGGGKTILGAHAIDVARGAWLERDHPLVLWFTPSTIIRKQTAEAFRDPRHPYRQVLNAAFEGRVRVWDIGEFREIRPHDLRQNLCVVVATIQTLRVKDTEGRKVYAHDENLEGFFTGLPPGTPGLEAGDDGRPRYSFANVLHLHQPLMVVDEAHGAVTGLTREMQARVNPSAIIELTATPQGRNNILHSVGAQALKAEQMVKLPIALAEHPHWHAAVTGAVATRARLAEAAKDEPDYIRPVALYQAQPKNETATVEVLRRRLIDDENVPAERIAVATGTQRELDGVDLFDPACPIEHVITVEALKEGWDAPFAYVFCSVQSLRSATDAEQLLGRVLRMPYARRRRSPLLNRAYAHLSESSFQEAARALTDRLIDMGFDEQEAREAVIEARAEEGGLALEGGSDAASGAIVLTQVLTATAALEALAARPLAGVTLTEAGEGRFELSLTGALSPEVLAAVAEAAAPFDRHALEAAARVHGLRLERAAAVLVMPALAVADAQGELRLADSELFMEDRDWRLRDHPAHLTPAEFDIETDGLLLEIDLEGERLVSRYVAHEGPLTLAVENWTEPNLVLWLDRRLRRPEIAQDDLVAWLSGAVASLTRRGIAVSALTAAKYPLAQALERKIAAAARTERTRAYQAALFERGARPAISFDEGFRFEQGMYAGARRYGGRHRFDRHLLAEIPALDGEDGGEEEQCAIHLDTVPGVKHWVRNVSRNSRSFRLPLADGDFYPDFVAELDDGRPLVVEYKGALTANAPDVPEKRAVGALWERSGGGLFLIVERRVDDLDMRGQIRRKIAG